jgi:hypothetical protein
MVLTPEERDARRERSRALVEEGCRKNRQEKVGVISDIIREALGAPVPFSEWLAGEIFDGLEGRHYVIVRFVTDHVEDEAPFDE